MHPVIVNDTTVSKQCVKMISIKCCLVLVCLWVASSESKDTDTKPDSFLKFITKSWKHCMNVPTLNLCFKQRSLLALDNLIKTSDPINFPGEMISLVKTQQNSTDGVKSLSETDLEKYLPKNLDLQEKTLDLLLDSAYTKFLSSRSIQIRFPQAAKPNTNTAEESRGDKKKGGGGFASGAMLCAMTMIPMALAGIGALAGKALMTSMLALMMSALLASRKSHDGGGGSSYEVISIPAGGHHHGHRRSLQTGQEMAYNASGSR